jgi:hypothetical protein
MTADRFYGGISDRFDILISMLDYIEENQPTQEKLVTWIISNTKARSEDAVGRHLDFLSSIELINTSDGEYSLDRYGKHLGEQEREVLYEALSNGVKGFDTILRGLSDGGMTDEEIMDLLVDTFDEAEMSTPGPAKRHREWLQVLGFIERENGLNQLTERGGKYLEEDGVPRQLSDTSDTGEFDITAGEDYSQEELEEIFNTGFGYRISGINSRRHENDERYILLFSSDTSEYDNKIEETHFEYVGEGLEGDQSEESQGNSALIDSIDSDIPVYFFNRNSSSEGWEYLGLVKVLGYRFEERDGREVIVFDMELEQESNMKDENQQHAGESELGIRDILRMREERDTKGDQSNNDNESYNHVKMATEDRTKDAQDMNWEDLTVYLSVHYLEPSYPGFYEKLYAGVGRDDAEAIIGVDWDTGPVWCATTYSNIRRSAKSDYNTMTSISEEGGLIAAYYGGKSDEDVDYGLLDTHMVLGVVPPGSDVRAVEYKVNVQESSDEQLFLKTLPLQDTVQVPEADEPELFEGHDSVSGQSVCEWKREGKKELVRDVYRELR